MYARGMAVRKIHGFLGEQYGTEVWPKFMRCVTVVVMAEIGNWQAGPLEPMYQKNLANSRSGSRLAHRSPDAPRRRMLPRRR